MTERAPRIGHICIILKSLQVVAPVNAPGVLESGGACRVR